MIENHRERKRIKNTLRKFFVSLSLIVLLLSTQVKPANAFGGQDVRNFFGSIANIVFQGKSPLESHIAVGAAKPSVKAVAGVTIDADAFSALQQQVSSLSLQFNSFNQAPSNVITTIDTAGGNLLRNSSFEAGGNGSIPSQWNTQLDSNSGNTFISQEGIHSGSYGLKFLGGGTGNFGISQPNTKTTPQRTYTLSAWVKVVNTPAATFRIGFWDEQNNKEGSFKNVAISGTKDWFRVSTTVTTPGLITDSKNYFPMLEVQGLVGGAVYLDDVQLTEGSVLTDYNTAQANAGSNSLALGDGSILGSTGGDLYPAQSGVGQLGTSNNRWSALNLSNASVDNNGNLNLSGNAQINGSVNVGSLSFNNNLLLSSTQSAIPVSRGGTGITGTPTSGQLLIGNGSGFGLANLTAGSGVTITNSAGGITIASTGGGSTAFSSITGGTNTSAAMVVGTGASLSTSGTGTVNANQLNGQTTSVGGALTTGGAFTTSGANALTLTTTGATSLTLPTSGTVTALGNTTTGSGSIVLATSPSLTTPNIGAATATTVNGLSLTANATGFSVAGGTTSKTLTVNNSLTLAGTDATTMTFPSASDTVVGLAATQTLTNKTFTAPTINGTVATTGLTMPAFTAGGNITGSGALSVTSGGATALTLDAGGAAAVNIGNTNANALAFGSGTNNPTYTFNGSGTFSTSTGTNTFNGNTTIAANKTLTLSSGTGTITQNYSNTTGAASTFNVTNSNAGAGTSVQGLSIAMVGTAPSSGTNTNTGINFPNVTAVANNTFNGITFGTGYTNFITSGNINVSSGGVITGAGSYNGVTLSSSAVQPAVAGLFTFQSTGANAVTLDAGGAAGVNIGTVNANAVTLGANTTVAANKNLTLPSGTGQISQTYSNTAAGNASVYNITDGNTTVTATTVSGLDLTLTNATNTNNSNTLNGVTFEAASNNNTNIINGINFASATGYTNFIKTPSIVISSAGNITGAGTIGSAAITVTSNAAGALQVGPNGASNPTLTVVGNVASEVTGLSITGAATGGTTALASTDSGANTNLTLDGKGTGTVGINTVSATSGLVTIGNTTSQAGLTVNGPLTATGFIKSTGSTGIGYGTGAGGTVTQLTSRTTGVTLNKTTGQITMFSAAGSATAATFTVTNSTVGAADTILLNQASGTNLYEFFVTTVAAGSFQITFFTTGGTAVDAPVINYTVVKGSSS